MGTDFYNYIILKIIPKIRFSVNPTSLRGDKYHEGYRALKKGMMIGTIDYSKLTGIIIPKVTGGILSHAALCVSKRDSDIPDIDYPKINPEPGQGNGLEVVEMTHLHFTFSDFFDICHESERVIIFACEDWDEVYTERLVNASLSFRIADYDGEMTLGVGALYCSELIYQADRIAGNGKGRLQCDLSDLMGLGREYISPDGLLTSKNVIVIWDSKGEFTGLRGTEIKKYIFKETA